MGVFISAKDSILEITLDQPKVNAIHANLSNKLSDIFLNFQVDDTLRVAIITGAGDRFFSAGWDLKAGETVNTDHGPGGFGGLTEMHNLSKPVIAAVNGLAIGGGFELALACDLIVAAKHAEFYLPETGLGIIPDAGGVLRLPKVIPRAVALEMLYTGKHLSAKRAYEFGLLNKVVQQKDLLEEARELAKKIIDGAPLAIAAIKEVLHQTEHLSVSEGYEVMQSGKVHAYEQVLSSEDAKEGPRAFSEKRKPVWKGK